MSLRKKAFRVSSCIHHHFNIDECDGLLYDSMFNATEWEIIILLFISQGCQFSGKSLNSGPGNLFSGHMFQFFVYKLSNSR